MSEAPAAWRVIPEGHTLPLADTAVLGDVEAFTRALLHTAQCQGFFDAPRSSITADGAAWLWGIASDNFPRSVQMVDGGHARQPLAAAAPAHFPDQPTPAAAWLHAQTEVLFEGPLAPLLAELNQAGLSEFAQYFEPHQARMRSLDFREAGLPIASASVESEVKQFKQRLAAPAMRWSRPGVERMIPLRAAVLDGSFDRRWPQAACPH